jgi:predicted TIM-barrel fold metal-dependent hydrolase
MDDYIFDFIQKNRREVFALKIHPSFARLPVDDKAFYPFFELAQTFSMPVVVHCGRWREVTGYEHVLNVAKMFSNVDFILSHMGGDSPPLVLGAARDILNLGLENCFLGTESIREYWLIERVVKMLGAKKLVFGSDHNLNHPRTFIATIEALRITAEEKSLIFGQNAMALLGKKARISR